MKIGNSIIADYDKISLQEYWKNILEWSQGLETSFNLKKNGITGYKLSQAPSTIRREILGARRCPAKGYDKSYEEWLARLNLFSLEKRWRREEIIERFKMSKGFKTMDARKMLSNDSTW